MRYSTLAPARLRPLLVLLANELAAAATMTPSAACVLKWCTCIRSFTTTCRLWMTTTSVAASRLAAAKHPATPAILAGDALLTLAFETLASHYDPATAAACCLELARGAGAAGMVGGQVEDLAWEKGERRGVGSTCPKTVEALENIHARKTGALFRACLRIGVRVAHGDRPGGPEPELLERFDAYGRCFGMAFQITDDLLDIEGSAVETGKRVQKDAVRGKLTYPSFWGAEESRQRARRLCSEACDRLQPLGTAGERLKALAVYVLERKH